MSEAIVSRVLIDGVASGSALVLETPLSLWGGLDPESGRVIDPRHPQNGEMVTDRILALPFGRGSSSASSILLEAVRLGTAPAAILTREVDGILALGATVAREMYGHCPPVLVLESEDYSRLTTGLWVEIDRGGSIQLGGS